MKNSIFRIKIQSRFNRVIAAATISCSFLSLNVAPFESHSEPLVNAPQTIEPERSLRPPIIFGGLGRYQLTATMLQRAGMLEADHRSWTGKYDVKNATAFLNSPVAQEKALEDIMIQLERRLKERGAWSSVGTLAKSQNGNFRVTESGLLAAAHAEGVGTVITFLRVLKKRDGSLPRAYENAHRNISFSKIESRLRDFAEIDFRAKR